ncbi:double zinc ribbon domain-containing protein [Natronorubrum aibiense]|uniref:CopG family transcriptional regulator n=1 Tax=Natronorubrum aibiense TaxID=348826 RepID=A0A5P9P073_9EURY|nr:zinc ribbon domain-containing protein [Natronorubrum aibiense]QFU81426.1 CopG family transcriptional regulator [Natronorubrum aibiense]
MSKITFRADDELVEHLETLELSKSEAMREALRAYLDDERSSRGADRERRPAAEQTGAIDDLVRERVDELLADRLHDLESTSDRRATNQDSGTVTVTVSLDDENPTPNRATRERSQTRPDDARIHEHDERRSKGDRTHASEEQRTQCDQCGEDVDDDHVYCPNCGEKASRRLFCECGDEIRSDWSFCPGCGRRTPAADVLSRDSHT